MSNTLISEIDYALTASQDILTSINNGDWKKVAELNSTRVRLIRSLSKCQKNASFWQKFGNKLNEIKCLDECIIKTVNNVHQQTLRNIADQQVKKDACIQYVTHKNNS